VDEVVKAAWQRVDASHRASTDPVWPFRRSGLALWPMTYIQMNWHGQSLIAVGSSIAPGKYQECIWKATPTYWMEPVSKYVLKNGKIFLLVNLANYDPIRMKLCISIFVNWKRLASMR
jgi:hypothetical protein